MTDREAMRLALDALENHTAIKHPQQMHYRDTAIEALRQALEQPQTPDDLLRQSEREGWRYAKECEAEVKRLRQALSQSDDAAWAKHLKEPVSEKRVHESDTIVPSDYYGKAGDYT